MKIYDKIYGEEEIIEPVLIELINSKSVQRLKGISQLGMPQEYYHKPVYSRYEHSIGVLILLRRLNADLKEQIAGLLHDVSHTAFSHVIDWVIGDSTKEDYQDNLFADFVQNSDIPFILNKYNINHKDIVNLENFSLLEKPTPHLCADRFDYSIREINWNNKKEITQSIVCDLINYNGNLSFNSKESAEIFAIGYSNCNTEHWAGNEAKVRYYLLAEILKRAININIISLEDLKKKQDDYIINLLIEKGDKDILKNINLLKNGFKIIKTNSDKGIILKKKFRYVDPEILLDDKMVKLSNISENYSLLLEKLKKESKIDDKIIILEILN